MNYLQFDNNTENKKSQEQKVLRKLCKKKNENIDIINYLYSIGEDIKANNIKECASFVGITEINGITKIVKSNFCRERVCKICAWRRQAKFISQMIPTLSALQNKGYNFIFATLTLKNCTYEEVSTNIDILMNGYNLLCKRREIKKAWKGMCRSVEITYNDITDTFHPHIHILIAVDATYNQNYISQQRLSQIWKESTNTDYTPIVDIRKVTDNAKASVETLKYALKPTQYKQALNVFLYQLKGRRLISFSGVINQQRKLLKYSSMEEDNLNDEINVNAYKYNLYKFDVTGGVYKFYEQFNS